MNNSGAEVNGEEEELVWIRNISLCRSGGDTLPLSFLESLSGEQVLSLWGIDKVHCSYGCLVGHARSTIMLRIHSLVQCGMTSPSFPLQENDVIVRVLGDPVTSLLQISQLFRFCDSLTVDVLRKKKRFTCPSKTHILQTRLLPSDDHNGIIALPSHDSSQDQQHHENDHNYYVVENDVNTHNQQSHHEHMIFQKLGEDQHYAEKRLIQRIRNHIILLPEQEKENPTANANIITSYATAKTRSQQDLTPKQVVVLPSPYEANHNQQSLLPQLQDVMQQQEQDMETQREQPRFLWFNCELNDTNTIVENSTNANPLHPYNHSSRNCTQMPTSTNNSLDGSSRFNHTISNRTRTDSITSINHSSSSTNASNKMKPLSTAAKAKLPAAKTKLKRLWPNSSIFQKRIMKWIPPEPISDINGVVRFRGPVQKAITSNETIPSSATATTSSTKPFSNDDILRQEISSLTKQTCKISDCFRDASHIVQEICPHLLEEARVNINDEFHNRSDKDGYWLSPTYLVRLQTVTPVDAKSVVHAANSPRTYEFGFQLTRTFPNSFTNPKISNNSNNISIPTNLGDVFAIHCQSWTNTKCCIGIVGSHDIHSTFLQDQKIAQEEEKSKDLFTLWLCSVSKDNEQTGWLSHADIPIVNPDGSVQRQVMHVLYLGSVITTLREFDGLKGLSAINRHLQRAIFCSNLKPPPPKAIAVAQTAMTTYSRSSTSDDNSPLDPPAPSRPSSLSQHCWNKICQKLNQYQAAAIETFMSGKAKENLFLLQGPPGTGKTEVVLNLISALLNGPCPQPGAWKSSGIAVHVGSSLSKSKGGSNSPSKCIVGNVKTRILVCAPSNIAVDDLACRIHESCIGPSGRVGGFILVRFGLLPGEERTEQGRKRTFQSTGTNNYHRTNSREGHFSGTKRDEFLYGINLDITAKSSVEKRNILTNAHVVCTTLNSSGSKSFIDASLRDDSASEYDVVIIDEACQASEPSSLIPFKFNPKAVILVGDPQQLPVTIRSQSAEQASLGRSLFQRLHSFGWPVEMLRIQYRMRPEIVQFPSNQFYDGQLITPNVPFPHMPWHSNPCLPPFLLWNVRNATMTRSATGGICNHVEKQFIIFDILSALEKVMFPYSNGKHVVEVGIISFYNDQVSLIKSSLAETTSKNKKFRIQVSTVDGFQGSEKDIIILSCVRARGGGVGFLSDYRRVNVALTRAKHSLWIVGDCDTLYSDAVWRNLIDDASQRCLIRDHSNFWNIFNSIRSPPSAANKNKRQLEPMPKKKTSEKNKRNWDLGKSNNNKWKRETMS